MLSSVMAPAKRLEVVNADQFNTFFLDVVLPAQTSSARASTSSFSRPQAYIIFSAGTLFGNQIKL